MLRAALDEILAGSLSDDYTLAALFGLSTWYVASDRDGDSMESFAHPRGRAVRVLCSEATARERHPGRAIGNGAGDVRTMWPIDFLHRLLIQREIHLVIFDHGSPILIDRPQLVPPDVDGMADAEAAIPSIDAAPFMREMAARAQRARDAPPARPAPERWHCDGCGAGNPGAVSVCQSCGWR